MDFVSWVPNSGGDWDTSTNWSTGSLPTSDDQVMITTATLQTITHSQGNDFAGSLAVGDDLFEMEGGALGVLASAAMANGFTITGGTFTVGTSLKIVGTLAQSGGDITAPSVTVTGSAQLLGGSLDGTLQATGLVTLASYDLLGSSELKNAHTLDQTGSITLGDDSGVDAEILNQAGATYNFDNSVNIDSGAATAQFVNSGTLAAAAETGTSTVDVQLTSTGKIEIGAGSTLAFAGPSTTLGGTISGAGTLGVAGGETTLAAGATLTVAALALYGDGALALGADETVSGGFSQADDSVLQLNGHTLTLAGAAQFSGSPGISDGGTLLTENVTSLGGDLTIGGGASWRNSGTVNDTHSFQIGDSSGTAATVTNAAGDIFDVAASGVTINTGEGSDSIANAGMLEMTATAGVSDIEVAVENSGTITVSGGTLEIDGTVTNSSLVTANGGTLLINGALANTGSVTASNGSAVDLFGGGTLGGTIGGGGGSVVLTGTFAVAAGKTESVKFGSGATLAATGTNPAYFSGAGTIATHGVVAVGNNGNNGGSSLQLVNNVDWQNDGVVNDAGDFRLGGSDGDSVELNNAAGATFNVAAEGLVFQNSSGGGGVIMNAGTFVKSAGTGISDMQVYFTNTGTISAKSGTLEFDSGGTLGGTIGGGAGQVVLDGTFSVATGATQTVKFGSGATLAATGTGPAYFSGAGTIETSGTVAVGNNGNNDGASLWLQNNVDWLNDGVVNDAGDFRLGGSDGDSVELNNAAGATFNVAAEGLVFQNSSGGGGVIMNAGTFVKSAGTGISDMQVYFTNTGTISAKSGTLEFDSGGTLGGTIGGGAGQVVLDGTFSVATGATQTVKFGSGATLAATGTGPAYFSGAGTIETSGTVAVGNNGNNDGASLWLQNNVDWLNDGVVNDAGDFRLGGSDGDSVELNNAAGATFNVAAEGLVFQNSSGGGGVIMNAGTFEKSAGTGISDMQVYFTNTGTIAADSGTLEFDDGGTNSGTIEALANASVTLEGTTLADAGGVIGALGAGAILDLDGETIDGGALKTATGGLIEADAGSNDTLNGVGVGAGSAATLAGGGALALTGTTNLAGTLTLTGSSTLDGTVSGAGTLAMSGGGAATIAGGAALSVARWSISGAGTVATLGEALTYKGAFSEGTGATLTLSGGALTLTGGASLGAATVNGSQELTTSGTTAVSGLTLGGTVQWNDAATATESGGVTLGDSSGGAAVLSIASTGKWDITGNTGIALGASTSSDITNAGLFEKTGGTGASAIRPGIVNTGTISVTSGTLDLGGALSGTGKDQIGDATLDVAAAVAGTQTFVYTAAGGDLALEDFSAGGALLFHGEISGFGAGDKLDVGAPFGTGTTFVYTENAGRTAGVLALTDGARHASIIFLGDYATSNFTPASDGHGGTLFTFHT